MVKWPHLLKGWGMKTKISGLISLIGLLLGVVANGQQIFGGLKMPDLSSVSNIASRWGLILIGIVAGGTYLREKYKEFRKKRGEEKETNNRTHSQHDDRLRTVEEFINKYVYSSDVLMREVKKVDVERQEILNKLNNFYNGITARLDGATARLENLKAKENDLEGNRSQVLGHRLTMLMNLEMTNKCPNAYAVFPTRFLNSIFGELRSRIMVSRKRCGLLRLLNRQSNSLR